MKRVEYIKSSAGMMIILLLICSIVCNSLDSTRYKIGRLHAVCFNNTNAQGHPATQLPEKVESENDYKHQNPFFVITQLITFIPLNSAALRHYFHFEAFRFPGNISGIPLYMSKRSLLI
jgi:hypothetical protein